jgi:hypothetical protein
METDDDDSCDFEAALNMSNINDRDEMEEGTVENATTTKDVCWLCDHNMEAEVVKISQFISDQAPYMGSEQMTQIVFQRLQEIDPDGKGHSLSDIKDHIQSHILSPSVRISNMLRALTMLLDRLEGALFTTSEDDTTIVDAKNVGIYLKVVNEVMQLYKTGECNKLMFGDNTNCSDKIAPATKRVKMSSI